MCTDPETWTFPAAWLARNRNNPRNLKFWEHHMSLVKENVKTVRKLYEAGTPWWTKEAIRSLDEQLERIRQSGDGEYEVTVTDLLGVPKKLVIKTGKFNSGYLGDLERVGYGHPPQPPHIEYTSYETLGFIHHPFEGETPDALHTLEVGQYEELRDRFTGEIITPYPLYTLDELRVRFNEKKASFEAGKICQGIIWTLENLFITLPPVRKVIAFATSTPSWKVPREGDLEPSGPTDTPHEDNENAIVQLSLALILRDFLQQYQRQSTSSSGTADDNEEIKCYVQEPILNENDKIVLGEHGITVLNDPHGLLEMDNETAVICFNADVPIRSLTAELARPAIMIWNRCDEDQPHTPREEFKVSYSDKDNTGNDGHEDSGVESGTDEEEKLGPDAEYCVQWTDPVTPRVLKMVEEEYALADFYDGPGFYDGFGLNPGIYVRNRPPPPPPAPRKVRTEPLLMNFSRLLQG